MQQANLLFSPSAVEPDQLRHPVEENGSDGRTAVQVRVLLVEDEILTAMDIEYILQQLGYDVCGVAASAPEAVKAARDLRPDMVLMDIRLAHGTDGIQAAGEIRTRFGIASLYLSAHTDAATLHRAQATQPLGFLSPSPIRRLNWRPLCRPPSQVCVAVRCSNPHRHRNCSAVGGGGRTAP